MGDQRRPTGTGWPGATPATGPAAAWPGRAAAEQVAAARPRSDEPALDGPSGGRVTRSAGAARRRLSSAGALIGVLLALFGFTLVVQLKSNSADDGLAGARAEDLVRILSDLEAREQRLRQDIATLESSQRQLTSGVQGRQAALEEAAKRADELGLLAGTLPARGAGVEVRLARGTDRIKASAILNAVQELRGSGAEAIQITGVSGSPVRVVASTFFLDQGDAVLVDGTRLAGPYTVLAIGEPTTMRTALNMPGGVATSVQNDGGTVIVQEREVVDVTALRRATSPRFARPVS
ncbi:MAG TPA: DUF881 domain-containing protein [Catenuloplanes sp.]